MLRPTPFHSRTGPLCQGQSWSNWAGFLAAPTYEPDHLHEYNAVRTGSGLFDVSPLFKYDIRGRDALAMVNRVAVRDLSKSRIGQVFYSVWCDDKGMVIDDGTISHLGEDYFRMTAAIPTLAWLQDNAIGLDVAIEDVSEQFAGLALQGPTSRDMLQSLTDVDLSSLRFFRCTDGKVAGAPTLISRTGYTGDLGYEVFVGPDDAEGLWDAMMEVGGEYQMLPAGLTTLDLLRIEGGLLGIDADFTSALQTMFPVQKLSVYDLGLGWMINPSKGFFVGRDALRRAKANGSRYDTIGLELDVTVMEKAYAEYGILLRRAAEAPHWAGDQRHVVTGVEEVHRHRAREARAREARQPHLDRGCRRVTQLLRPRAGGEDAVLRSALEESLENSTFGKSI